MRIIRNVVFERPESRELLLYTEERCQINSDVVPNPFPNCSSFRSSAAKSDRLLDSIKSR